jgi:hypothetical protein
MYPLSILQKRMPIFWIEEDMATFSIQVKAKPFHSHEQTVRPHKGEASRVGEDMDLFVEVVWSEVEALEQSSAIGWVPCAGRASTFAIDPFLLHHRLHPLFDPFVSYSKVGLGKLHWIAQAV